MAGDDLRLRSADFGAAVLDELVERMHDQQEEQDRLMTRAAAIMDRASRILDRMESAFERHA